MRTDPIYLIGAGGHGRVVAGALLAAGVDAATIVVRDGRTGLTMLGRAVLTPEVTETMAGRRFHVTVGASAIRARLHSAALSAGAIPITVIHPAAVVSADAMLEDAVLVAATAVVAPGAHVGTGTIVNHAAVVDHEIRIGTFCHIAPNATLGGGVTLGDRVMVGAGAVVLPNLSVASDVTIGAGAVVLRSIGEAGIWIGNPARRLAR
ncbi:NeuD/PglB/VioB family sugar acetyltransferase [Sphingomonas sp.]|uniref:NeuD/PglB/VioB family sugar acetyltransferase n=1 Tax=Sphingomonas sp. TaxID=28214 RepID=UPI0035BBA67B